MKEERTVEERLLRLESSNELQRLLMAEVLASLSQWKQYRNYLLSRLSWLQQRVHTLPDSPHETSHASRDQWFQDIATYRMGIERVQPVRD